jgi:Uma2 family endonuclease
MIAKAPATIDDLYRVNEKAELVNGEIVYMMPTGYEPGYAASEIFVSLRQYIRVKRHGFALNDNQAFVVDLPHRKSFSPDAAYTEGPNPGMKFFEGAPLFAVEVRSDGDYGPKAERDIADKRADYFEAGTKVVWDVDLDGPDIVRKYTGANRDRPTIFRRGEIADAEPAVPGWTMPVNDLFEKQS